MDKENQNEPSTVGDVLRKIEEKVHTGEYIYRGESKHFETVSSNLYRVFFERKDFDVTAEHFDVEIVQKRILDDAKKYLRRTGRDCEILVEMQHYGGKTNLIDFTTDHCVALFFACEKLSSQNGRIIFQKRELISSSIKEPLQEINRVVAQSSVFVRPLKGFIDLNEEDVINVPSSLKVLMLEHLRTEYDISTETIYNDIHGFITYQESHLEAYVAFYKSFLTANQQ